MNDTTPDFYTPLDKVKEELEKRWNDKAFRNKVEAFLGPQLPSFLQEAPRAYLVRCMASPDNEFFNFIKLTEMAGLEPAVIDYPEDKFVAKNSDKYALCNLHFFSPKAKNFNETSKLKIINFNKYEGKKFKDIETLWGVGLVDFHHEFLRRSMARKIGIFDFSQWFFSTRYLTEYYYLYYLGLFMCHGVLFENMLLGEEERQFTLEKILPSFNRLVEIFGVKPLIVPVTPTESEEGFFWWCYPEQGKMVVEKYVDDLMKFRE